MPTLNIFQEWNNDSPVESSLGRYNGTIAQTILDIFSIGNSALGYHDYSAIRFRIPTDLSDKRIISARINGVVQFIRNPSSLNQVSDTIYAAAADDASVPTTNTAFNTALAALTTAHTTWGYSSTWAVGNTVQTPDVKAILDEVLGRGGWVSNNHVVFYFLNTAPPTSLIPNMQLFINYTGIALNRRPYLTINYEYKIPGDTNTPFVKSEVTVLQFISVYTNSRDVSDTIVVNQTISYTVIRNKSITSIVTVDQDVNWIGVKDEDVQQQLIIDQVIGYTRAYLRDVQSVIIVSDENTLNGGHFRQVFSTIVVDQDISYVRVHNKTINSILTPIQTIHVTPIKISVTHTLDVSQTIEHSEVLLNPHAITSDVIVDQTISYAAVRARYVENDLTVYQFILATGTVHRADNGQGLSPATFGSFSADNYNATTPTSPTSLIAKQRPDTQYRPIRTSDATTTHPVASTLVIAPQLTVTLSYPIVSPTHTITIPAPLFGNREELQVTRIQRKSLGGDLKVFTDENWARIRTLRWQFEHVDDTLLAEYFDFLLFSLGLEIKIVDYENRTWHGFIVTPETESTDISPDHCDNTIGFEFIGREV